MSTPHPPLSLRAIGSYMIGGQQITISGRSARSIYPMPGSAPLIWDDNGTYWDGQMAVQYLIPTTMASPLPLVLVHGGGLSGSCFDATPDGREGWISWLARAGFAVHVVDLPGRGRSPWMPLADHPGGAPLRYSDAMPFTTMRIGRHPLARPEEATEDDLLPNCRFPVKSWAGFAKRFSPFWLDDGGPAVEALSALFAKLGSCQVLAHSAGCPMVLRAAARHPGKVRSMVLIEPTAGGDSPAALEGARLLSVWGDNIAADPTGRWPKHQTTAEGWLAEARGAGCQWDTMALPLLGIQGNSHLMMMDTNSLTVIERIKDWLLA